MSVNIPAIPDVLVPAVFPSLNGLIEMVVSSVLPVEILRSEAAIARFERVRHHWIEKHTFICREHAIILGEEALEQNDVEMAVLFYRYALELLERTAEHSLERDRRWSQKVKEGLIPEDGRPPIGTLRSGLMLNPHLDPYPLGSPLNVR